MTRLLDMIRSYTGSFLWLDDRAYAERIIANGAIPWLDVSAFVAFRRKTNALLRTNLIIVPVDDIVAAWLKEDAPLRNAMGAGARVLAPLRTLLSNEKLRAHLREMAENLRGSFPNLPLILQLPSPRAWILSSNESVRGHWKPRILDEDEVDSASVYMADFLRCFGDVGIDALLLVERRETDPASTAEVAWYQPVFNVAGHYRWEVGLQFSDAQNFSGQIDGPAFVIATTEIVGAISGIVAPSSYWNDGILSPSSADGFVFAAIPAEAVPETVLDRISTASRST